MPTNLQYPLTNTVCKEVVKLFPELHLICMCADAVIGIRVIVLVDKIPNPDMRGVTAIEIDLVEFIMEGTCSIKVSAHVCPETFTVATPIGVEVNKIGLEAAMTTLLALFWL